MRRLSRVFLPVGALALLLSEVLLITSCFLVVTFLILNVDPAVFLFTDNGLLRIGIAVVSILFGLFFEDLYTQIHVKVRVLLVQQLCLTMGIALLIQGVTGYVNDGFRLPLRVMIPAAALVVVALFTWRIAYSASVLRVVGPQRILLVGTSPLLEEMAGHIEAHPDLGLQIVGYVGDEAERPPQRSGVKALGPLGALPEITDAVKPDRIVVGFTDRRGRMPIKDLLRLRYDGQSIEEAAGVYEQLCGRVVLSELGPSQVLFYGGFKPRPERLVYQTLGNWLLAAFLAVLCAPLFVLTAVLLKLSSSGPLLSRKPRTGLGGRPFTLYAFRLNSGGGAGLDRLQSFVRRWRLHLLPQLWNILRGDIVFVGPRPERPEFVEALNELIPFYRQRYRVKPGLTGWAQINMPPEEPEDTLRRLEYDFYYLKNLSRGLDTYILVHTLKDLLISRPAD